MKRENRSQRLIRSCPTPRSTYDRAVCRVLAYLGVPLPLHHVLFELPEIDALSLES